MKRQPSHTVGGLILKSARWLEGKGVDAPRLDAELLLSKVLGVTRLQLYLDWEKPLVELEVAAYRELIRTRGQERTPVARLLGRKEFYGRDFTVTPHVFVPRPETEGLVERALRLIETEAALRQDNPVVFDIGTGSGCIVVTMAAEDAGARYLASDASPPALETARLNAKSHGVDKRIEFRNGEILAAYDGPLHMIVSNPPYIRTAEIETLRPEVKTHDPRLALDGGPDGLDVIRQIADVAETRLEPAGVLLMEIGEEQAAGTLQVFAEVGALEDATVERDDFGKSRYAFARRKRQ